ncbi:hypothetical protein [Flavobacterium sp. I3-2]|uniref:hypothetical protein n=1 Tax=Flavobacterium sp. I3-2 TaxID=2748319 RepID=UPI0015ADB1DA|nr:hypothetical protein [Flavobacterium sp. I3-2]
MNLVDISTLNVEVELDVLKRDTQRNSLFLYQHKGVFFADNTRIGNNNQEEAITKFTNVLIRAKDDNTALVLSPEYSCPKRVIEEVILNGNIYPPQGKIWVLGGESLSKVELTALKGLNNDNHYIYFEDCYTNSDKNYVDPLYYIFRGIHEGVEKLIILIQFKSRHMGGLRSSQLEAENLIEGENVYIIKNNHNSIRLMSFICSQAINFDASYKEQLINHHSWTDSPFLVLNLQYNPNPSHIDFIAFKKFVLEKEKRELITLNWGIETTFINGNNLYNETNTPRSAIYFRTTDDDLDFRTVNIEENHKKGLYFLQILRTKRVYFLNGNVELFKIYNKPVSIDDGQDVQQRREGPTIGNIFIFNEDLNLSEINQIEDNHINFLIERGIQNSFLLNTDTSIIDKERLINISTGKVKSKVKDNWSDVIHLNSFILNESDECNNRLTYIEDRYPSSEQVRMINCSNIFELDQNIIPTASHYPHSIKHLENKNISLAYADNAQVFNYKYNLVSDNRTIEKATVCYVGSAVSPREVNKVYDALQNLFDEESPGKYTIVVFYKQGNTILNKSNPEAGSITETPNSNNSIS